MLRASSAALMLRSTAVLREQETWRDHKITYLQYLNICTEALHSAVKHKVANKYTKYSATGYQAQAADSAGVLQVKETVPKTTAEYATQGATSTQQQH